MPSSTTLRHTVQIRDRSKNASAIISMVQAPNSIFISGKNKVLSNRKEQNWLYN